jgi:L-threonylcarbamoyladenylate synthase
MINGVSLEIQQQIGRGVIILRQGGLVAYPTDTVYGLGAWASLTQAVEHVYEIKERPRNMPLPLLLADVSQIGEFTEEIPQIALPLINSFLPGALTLVLIKSSSVPDIITGGGKTVAIRIPAHPIPVALIRGLGAPIVGTSANISGRSSLLAADEVYAQLGDRVDLIIDGGRCPGGKESTVVDVTGGKVMIIREGAISREELERVCQSTLVKKGE